MTLHVLQTKDSTNQPKCLLSIPEILLCIARIYRILICYLFPGGFSNTLELCVGMVGCSLNMKELPIQHLTCFYLHPIVLNTNIWSTGTVHAEGQDVNLGWGGKNTSNKTERVASLSVKREQRKADKFYQKTERDQTVAKLFLGAAYNFLFTADAS